MEHGVIPKHLHLDNPNPNVDWEQLPVQVTTATTDWPTVADRPPRAGVSAFGSVGYELARHRGRLRSAGGRYRR